MQDAFQGGRISFDDLCSLDLLGQDKINPREHSHSDEDAEGEEGVGFEVVHICWFFLLLGVRRDSLAGRRGLFHLGLLILCG